MEMYKANTDIELKKKIIFSLGQTGQRCQGTAFLKEIATGNSEDRLKEEAVFWIGQKGGDASANMLKACTTATRASPSRKRSSSA